MGNNPLPPRPDLGLIALVNGAGRVLKVVDDRERTQLDWLREMYATSRLTLDDFERRVEGVLRGDPEPMNDHQVFDPPFVRPAMQVTRS